MAFERSTAQEFLRLSDSAIADIAENSQNLANIAQYSPIVESIKTIASKAFPGSSIKVNLVGSRVIGVASDRSSLDVFVEIDGKSFKFFAKDESSQHETQFNKLSEALKASSDWNVKSCLKGFRAPVPLIFAYFEPLRLECAINTLNEVSTRNSALLAYFFEIQPEAVKLFHFIKQWLKVQGLDKLRNYILTLLVVRFLQSEKLLPFGKSFSVGQDSLSHLMIIDQSRTLESYGCLRMNDYKQHVSAFFEFFYDYDYTQHMLTFDSRVSVMVGLFRRAKTKAMRSQGILIAGPCSFIGDCCASDELQKIQFVGLCEASKDFFRELKF